MKKKTKKKKKEELSTRIRSTQISNNKTRIKTGTGEYPLQRTLDGYAGNLRIRIEKVNDKERMAI